MWAPLQQKIGVVMNRKNKTVTTTGIFAAVFAVIYGVKKFRKRDPYPEERKGLFKEILELMKSPGVKRLRDDLERDALELPPEERTTSLRVGIRRFLDRYFRHRPDLQIHD